MHSMHGGESPQSTGTSTVYSDPSDTLGVPAQRSVDDAIQSDGLHTYVVIEELPDSQYMPPVQEVMGLHPATVNQLAHHEAQQHYGPFSRHELAIRVHNAFFEANGDVLNGHEEVIPQKIAHTALVLREIVDREMLLFGHHMTERPIGYRDIKRLSILGADNEFEHRSDDWRMKQALEDPVALYPNEQGLTISALRVVSERYQGRSDAASVAQLEILQAAEKFVQDQTVRARHSVAA